MTDLTTEQKAVNFETEKHIHLVQHLMNKLIKLQMDRAENHDRSKLDSPEVEAFTAETSKLHGLTFGSPEYYEQIKTTGLDKALAHHYARNRHHPEHYPSGVRGMNLVDVLEMLCDWYASSLRQDDGNLKKSIDICAKRFEFSGDVIHDVLKNTVDLFEE